MIYIPVYIHSNRGLYCRKNTFTLFFFQIKTDHFQGVKTFYFYCTTAKTVKNKMKTIISNEL